MRFTKMHGLGNDYVYVNGFTEPVDDPVELARRVADRHRGIGADGLIVVGPATGADVRMEMYNADGSRAQMCGNGLRCVGVFACREGLVRGGDVTVDTDAGRRRLRILERLGRVYQVRADMGAPVLECARIPCTIPANRAVDHPLTVGGRAYHVTCVSMGNPHVVVFPPDADDVDLASEGRALETAAEFHERTNVHFARVIEPGVVSIRTWERGSGATQACGTGACAVCVAGSVSGRTNRRITARLPGGALEVQWDDDNHVYLTGPAEVVFTGDWPVSGAS